MASLRSSQHVDVAKPKISTILQKNKYMQNSVRTHNLKSRFSCNQNMSDASISLFPVKSLSASFTCLKSPTNPIYIHSIFDNNNRMSTMFSKTKVAHISSCSKLAGRTSSQIFNETKRKDSGYRKVTNNQVRICSSSYCISDTSSNKIKKLVEGITSLKSTEPNFTVNPVCIIKTSPCVLSRRHTAISSTVDKTSNPLPFLLSTNVPKLALHNNQINSHLIVNMSHRKKVASHKLFSDENTIVKNVRKPNIAYTKTNIYNVKEITPNFSDIHSCQSVSSISSLVDEIDTIYSTDTKKQLTKEMTKRKMDVQYEKFARTSCLHKQSFKIFRGDNRDKCYKERYFKVLYGNKLLRGSLTKAKKNVSSNRSKKNSKNKSKREYIKT